VAYLHLVTAGEILSSWFQFDKEDLLDDDSAKLISSIRTSCPDGVKLAKSVLGKLLLVKRRFVHALVQLVDSEFFARSENAHPFPKFASATFPEVVAAAYDLRSRYVHTGCSFGQWVSLRAGGMNNELQVGKPVVADRDLGDILAVAPTYVGLERILRYCLLRLAAANNAYADPSAGTSAPVIDK
jgi:hypothetical protein